MDQIQHKYVDTRGMKLHIAEIGAGPVVIFVHGFPEIWYSWRNQMIAAANAGFRAIAPDLIGYGLSDKQKDLENACLNQYVDDILAILDSFEISKVFLVGRDFGVWPVYLVALQHPERVSGVVTLGAPFNPAKGTMFQLPEGFYIHRFREPGRADVDFARFDVKTVVRIIYILFSRSEIPIAEEGQELMDLVDPSIPLPSWLSEDDLSIYATLYEKSGFQGPLQVPYRSMEKMAPLHDPIIEVPMLVIIGESDYILKFPDIEEYVKSERPKHYVPNLEIVFVPEGSHFVQEQFPEKVNELVLTFLKNHL